LLPPFSNDLVPQTIATAHKINHKEGPFFPKTLFDSGADWAQATMEQVFWDMLHELDCYINNMSIVDLLWDTHVPKLDQVLGHLHSNGFSVYPLKCEWGVKETDFLGYWMTPTGLKPWLKQIEPILALAKPETLKQLRGFIGLVNFYRSM
jgi:hypothetical protein